jgi:RNA polymerase sigma-70 factor (ECF subfamily)
MAARRELGHTRTVTDPRRDPRLVAGREDALVQTYLAKRSNLVRLFAARTGSRAAAEDLAQELFLKLAEGPPVEVLGDPEALLYRMALNLMLDRIRGETRSAARDAAWRGATRAWTTGEEIADEPPADEAVASRERLRRLVDAVAGLPPQMQRAFRLHKLEGLTHAQTARAMGLSVKSVEKHVSAALKVLMEKVGR